MSDAWLVIAIFVFAFVLWVSTGGPTRPISFSGPFITPITDVGDVQEGYGGSNEWYVDDSNASFWSTRTIFGRFEGVLDDDSDIGASPETTGRVSIVGGDSNLTTSDARRERIVLRARSGTATITGWQLVSRRTNARAVIPLSDAGRAIVLESGDEAVITTGASSEVDRAERQGGTWRIYLGQDDDLWRNSSDTIELIDAIGRVVDTYTY